jgi:hypothetical protein
MRSTKGSVAPQGERLRSIVAEKSVEQNAIISAVMRFAGRGDNEAFR